MLFPPYVASPFMPEISRFFGIVIKMFFDDYNPPSGHAKSRVPRRVGVGRGRE
jgi:hypothetical protein